MESLSQNEKSGIESVGTTFRKIMDKALESLDYTGDEKYIDLHELDVEKVEDFLNELEASDKFVFHSNSTKEILDEIQPREARDNHSEENSMNAVFGSPRYLEALAYGVINKFNVSKIWKGFTLQVGHEKPKGVSIKMSPEIRKLISENESEYLQDVLLYVLDKNEFDSVPNREGDEYYSEDSVSPIAALYVPRDLAIKGIDLESFNEEETGMVSAAEPRSLPLD